MKKEKIMKKEKLKCVNDFCDNEVAKKGYCDSCAWEGYGIGG